MSQDEVGTKVASRPELSFEVIVATIKSWDGTVAALPSVTAAIMALNDLQDRCATEARGLTKFQQRELLSLFWEKFQDVADPVPVPLSIDLPDTPDAVEFIERPLSAVDGLTSALMQTGDIPYVVINGAMPQEHCLGQLFAVLRRAQTAWKFSGSSLPSSPTLSVDMIQAELDRALAAKDSLWLSAYVPMMWVGHLIAPDSATGGYACQEWMTLSGIHGFCIFFDEHSIVEGYGSDVRLRNVSISVNMPVPTGPDVFTQMGKTMNDAWFDGDIRIEGVTSRIGTADLRLK